MEHKNDGTFSVFKQRELQLGTETVSITEYKDFEIQIRTYAGAMYAAITATIYGRKNEKRIRLRTQGYSFMVVEKLLQKQKNYIDEYSQRLNDKLQNSKK